MQFNTDGKILKEAVKLLSKFNSGVSINGDYVRIATAQGETMLNMTVSSSIDNIADIDYSRASINIKISDDNKYEQTGTAYIRFADLKSITDLGDKKENFCFKFYKQDKPVIKVQIGDSLPATSVVTIPYRENIATYNDLNAVANYAKDSFIDLTGLSLDSIGKIADKIAWGCTFIPSNEKALRNVLIEVDKKSATFLATNKHVVNRKRYTATNDRIINKEQDKSFKFAIDGKFFQYLSANMISWEQNLKIDKDSNQLVFTADDMFITFEPANMNSYSNYNFNSVVDGISSDFTNTATFSKYVAKGLVKAVNSAIKLNNKNYKNTIIMRFNQADSKIYIQSFKEDKDDLIKYKAEIPVNMNFANKNTKEVAFGINGKYLVKALKTLYKDDKRDFMIDEQVDYTIKFNDLCLKPIALTSSADNYTYADIESEYLELITPVLIRNMKEQLND